MTIPAPTFIHPLRRFRFEKRWLLKDLAELCDCSSSQLSRLERGLAGLNARTAKRIVEATGLTLDQILSEPPNA